MKTDLLIRNVTFSRRLVVGDFDTSVRFVNCRFTEGVTADHATISGSLTFTDCSLGDKENTSISLRHASVEGDLKIDLDLGRSEDEKDLGDGTDSIARGHSINLSAANISGNVTLSANRLGLYPATERVCSVSILAQRASIRGDLSVYCSNRFNPVRFSCFDAGGITIGGNLFVYGRNESKLLIEFSKGDQLQKSVNLFGSCIGGQVYFKNAELFGSLSLYAAEVKQSVSFHNVSIEGDLECGFAKIDGFFSAYHQSYDNKGLLTTPLEVRGKTTLSGAQVGSLEMRAVTLRGGMQCIKSRFGYVTLSCGPVGRKSTADEFREARRRRFSHDVDQDIKVRLQPCEVGFLRMESVEVDASVDLVGLHCILPDGHEESLAKRLEVRNCSVSFHQCRIGGSLLLHKDDLVGQIERRPGTYTPLHWEGGRPSDTSVRADFWGNVKLTDNTIGEDCDLRNSQADGLIDLSRTNVKRDLVIGVCSRIGSTGRSTPPILRQLVTECRQFDAENLECHGQADLTGLRVIEAPAGDLGNGRLSLAGAWLRQGLLLALPDTSDSRVFGKQPFVRVGLHHELEETEKEREWSGRSLNTRSPWIIDLSGLTAGRLTIRGESVANGSGVKLEGAKLTTLHLVSQVKLINLTRVEVASWLVTEDEGEEEHATDVHLKEIMKATHPFDRSTWLAVEQSRRDTGHEQQANAIYRAVARKTWLVDFRNYIKRKRDRDRDHSSHPLWEGCSKMFHFVVDPIRVILEGIWTLLGAGTYTTAVALLIFLISLWCAMLFQQPDAIVASPHLVASLASIPVSDGSTDSQLDVLLADSETQESSSTTPDAVEKDNATKQKEPAPANQPEETKQNTAQVPRQPATAHSIRPEQIQGDWDWTDRIFVSLRYSVPISLVLSKTDWKASSNEVTAPWLGVTVKASTAAHLVVLIGLVTWPMLLIGLAARVYRGTRT